MDSSTFMRQVAQRAGVPTEQANALTAATLETLAERLTGVEAPDLAAQLPQPLQVVLGTTPGTGYAERFGASEFVARVARRG